MSYKLIYSLVVKVTFWMQKRLFSTCTEVTSVRKEAAIGTSIQEVKKHSNDYLTLLLQPIIKGFYFVMYGFHTPLNQH